MIKTYYGNSIYADIKNALAEKGLSEKVHVLEPNQGNVAAMLKDGTCPMPCVLPYVERKYLISPTFDTYTTVGADGEKRIHTIDFNNSMPVMLYTYFTVLTFTIPELEEFETCLVQRYSQPCNLSWTGLPKEDDTFSFALSLDKSKDIKRDGGKQTFQGEQKSLYQSILYAKTVQCVEITKPYSAIQIDLDIDLQLRLVKKIKVLDNIYTRFTNRKAELSANPVTPENEATIRFIDYALSVIPNVRTELLSSLKIPADCAQPEMIKELAKILTEEECSIKSVIDRIIETRRKEAEEAAQQKKAEAERNEQIQAVKLALDLSIRIAQLREQIEFEAAQTYPQRPPAPVKQEVPPPVYPPIKTNIPLFTKERMAKSIFGGGGFFSGHQQEVKAEEERIRNSPEYQQQCAAIDEAYRKRVAYAEEQYQANLKQYNEVILPCYEQGFAEWKKQHEEKLAAFETELAQSEAALAAHYETTNIVSAKYRTINALQFIYDGLTDPAYHFTVTQVVGFFDQAVQRRIEEERLEEERRRAEAEEAAARAEEERQARYAEAEYDDYYSSGSSGGGGLINRSIRRSQENARRDREMREEMYRQERMKKDYYCTGQCPRSKLGGSSKSCSSCTLAPMCKRASRGY